MATSESSTKSKLISEMQSRGFDPLGAATNGEGEKYIEAIAAAIVRTIKEDAQVTVSGGSSAGTYPVQ